MVAAARPRIALCLEQTLGHVAHGRSLEAVAAGYPAAEVTSHHVGFAGRSRFRPPWAVRGSAAALASLRRSARPDVAFFHTQTIGLFAPLARARRGYVVSVDATPLQIDAMGRWYAHDMRGSKAETLKRRWYRSVLGRASVVVAWSQWAASSLEADYGVPRSRIRVLHPGAPDAFFDITRGSGTGRSIPRILFVGADFERKGGPQLLRAFANLGACAELTLVTNHPVPPNAGVKVVAGVEPGSRALLELYSEADIFCLPTLGDCTPVVLGEAMAAGLPVVTTAVGSNVETVPDGEAGIVVEPGDVGALAESLSRLVCGPALRRSMGEAARDRASRLMRASDNGRAILDLLSEMASSGGPSRDQNRGSRRPRLTARLGSA
jgi:glycosyltransferase involved in cell wall biosynthesis